MDHPGQAANIGKNNKLKDYLQLTKPSLNIMVVFSSVISYLLAPRIVQYDLKMILLLFAGGFLVTGSANAINMAVEKETDAKMKRTAKRPVASGRMKPSEAWAFAVITGITGVFILGFFFNLLSAGLALFSLFLYAFIYTPLKKVNSVAVLIGAFPGALPCLIGWAAGNDSLFEAGHGWKDYGGWILFAIQFLWQFPHFWAIAWISHKDYSNAGFRLLPTEQGPTKMTALQTIIYALLLLPVGVLPYVVKLSGFTSMVIVIIANLFLVMQCIRLYREMEASAARRVMFSSYIYLPVVLLALLADKL
ncbi:MAG TPA: heme o synthase [Flavisolibacter sp.]|nr:heme o synthase [Flavisolibacter sp.]